VDLRPHLRDIYASMWIRPGRQIQARMPSMRPPATSPAPGSVADMQQRRTAPPPTPPAPSSEEEEKKKRAGGFHESSYELRTGMDVLESGWPDDVTIPGALDED
jgi:hypothetical protein